MKRLFILPITFILLIGIPAFADYATGVTAYKNGHFDIALDEWRPLAEQDDTNAHPKELMR